MKVIIVALALVAAVAALPVAEEKRVAQIVRSLFDQQPNGNYNFDFETDNGIKRVETGQLKSFVDAENKPHEAVVVRGSFSYVNSEGNVETINYVADENGYRAEGPSIPQVAARR